jgi:mannosyl-3-phosphoglycerate phosphatase
MLALPLVVFTEPLDEFLPRGHPAERGAAEALGALERRQVPLIFSSRGTRVEVEFVRRRIGNRHPFITENGGGVFVPEGYFRQRIPGADTIRNYHCVSLAQPYEQACSVLEEAAEEAHAEVVGFHQMSAKEIAENTGLPQKFAEMARLREYDEPFFFAGEEEAASRRLELAVRTRGWRIARGERFWHCNSGADIAAAVRRVMEMYRADKHRGRMRSAAIGRSRHQLPMLAAAGRAIVLPAAEGSYDEELLEKLPAARRAAEGGITGWNQAVIELIRGGS